MSLGLVLEAVLPVYVMAAAGMALRWRKVLTAEMEKGVLQMVIHLLYPCLILDKVLGNPLARSGATVGWGVGLGFGFIILGMVVSFGYAKAVGMARGGGLRTFTLAGGVQNFGYTAIPILASLFVLPGGDDSVLGLLFIHSLGVELAIWIVGLMVLTGSWRQNPRLFLNGPIVAVVLGLALSWTGGWQLLTAEGGGVAGAVVRQSMHWLGNCAFPIGLILIGATMFGLVGEEKPDWKIALGAVLVRLAVMPAVILGGAWLLPITTELKQVLVVQAAMPAAVTPIIVARHYGGNPGVAVQTVVVTSVLALVTIPLWLAVGVRVVFP